MLQPVILTLDRTAIERRRCAVYLRISLDQTGEQLGVQRQREDCAEIIAARGWAAAGEYVDNSVSAFKRGKVRPAYDRMVRDYAAGLFDAVAVWDLDRLTRQPAQLEAWIDAAEDRGLMLVTANGEADLSTQGGRLFARMKAAVARSEMEQKSARQIRAARQRAEMGRAPLGPELTGYTSAIGLDGRRVTVIDEDEAALVRAMFARFHSGDSLRGITQWLNDSGAVSRSGRAWSPSTASTILRNPRYCGRAVYRGPTEEMRGGYSGFARPMLAAMRGAWRESVYEVHTARLCAVELSAIDWRIGAVLSIDAIGASSTRDLMLGLVPDPLTQAITAMVRPSQSHPQAEPSRPFKPPA
jgi:DNA invertase Pin-like site-specific DNA recombinase